MLIDKTAFSQYPDDLDKNVQRSYDGFLMNRTGTKPGSRGLMKIERLFGLIIKIHVVLLLGVLDYFDESNANQQIAQNPDMLFCSVGICRMP
jgi:hypothetical protein